MGGKKVSFPNDNIDPVVQPKSSNVAQNHLRASTLRVVKIPPQNLVSSNNGDQDIHMNLSYIKQEILTDAESITQFNNTTGDTKLTKLFCELCSKNFTRNKYLNEHQRKYHT